MYRQNQDSLHRRAVGHAAFNWPLRSQVVCYDVAVVLFGYVVPDACEYRCWLDLPQLRLLRLGMAGPYEADTFVAPLWQKRGVVVASFMPEDNRVLVAVRMCRYVESSLELA